MRLTATGLTRSTLALLSALLAGGSAQAFEIQLGEESTLKVDNLITVGGVMRMQDRDISLIGKPNVRPGLCMVRTSGTADGGASPHPNYATNTSRTTNTIAPGSIPNVCATSDVSTPTRAIVLFNNSPGSFSPNGDNGNLNFDKGDIVHATAKITSDITLSAFGFNAFARALYFYDDSYETLIEYRPDTIFNPRTAEFSGEGKETIGSGFQFLDYFVSRAFSVGDRNFVIKAGNQVLNWGESAFLIPNSLNSISPPNQALLRIPGFDIKELFQPVGMVFASADLFSGVTLEGFYQYDFKEVVVDPVGTFFSSSDTLGDGGSAAMLSFSRAPEDYGYAINDPRYPAGRRGFYRAIDTCNPANPGASKCADSAGLLGSVSSRTIFRDFAEEKRRYDDNDGGQYGFALKYFAEWLNGGTEFGFYHANYHSRFPTVSLFAAQETCLAAAADVLPGGACGTNIVANLGPTAVTPATREPLPVDTARLIVEYPEDIRMYGLSFNTTIGDWAFAGEYAFRDNLPIQIHTVDLTLAAVNPAFPVNDITAGTLTIPGRRSAAPDFVETNYRGRGTGANRIKPGDYIQGFERMKQGQADITFIKTIGGDNPIGATQIAIVLEFGHTYVFDFPELDELQFQGAGTDTHISSGADGSIGINPLDIRTNAADASTNRSAVTSRQNPTAHADRAGFGTQESYGYRAVALSRYDSAFLGINLEFLTGFFHDVEGVGPGIGQNFVEGRKQILYGIRWDYLSKYTGELRYTWFTGGANRDSLRDRDNLLLFLGYQF